MDRIVKCVHESEKDGLDHEFLSGIIWAIMIIIGNLVYVLMTIVHRILVMTTVKIDKKRRHDELLEINGTYTVLYQSQFKE